MDEAQYFTAMFGVDGWMGATRGSPVEWSFCRNVVIGQDEFVVENALEHEIMKDSLLVQNEQRGRLVLRARTQGAELLRA